ncbi:hypothetical protein [Brenneria corticis]|uniref:hypothetical protein n=1 Tax=Brenneria corticis TaxID=2173106 RepID=UPI00109DADC3|nr:hypothetical protein [Brenneria sp. CFCC 11842]
MSKSYPRRRLAKKPYLAFSYFRRRPAGLSRALFLSAAVPGDDRLSDTGESAETLRANNQKGSVRG